MKIIFLGDIVGKSGRKAVKMLLPELNKKYKSDFIIANGENAAGGYGLTEKIAEELFSYGVDVITSGNHIWKREFYPYLQKTERVIRPANYGPGAPGKGWTIYTKNNIKIGIINLEGRIFMRPLENPFLVGKSLAEELKKETPFIIVDFHAEATSEKIGLGYFLDGLVSAVIGTHTHVQTSDARILANGTGYITDVGMCGALESVIGMKVDQALEMYISMVPRKLEVEKSGKLKLEGVFLELNSKGKAEVIESFRLISS
ncbi:TIGR00282 family metallophosphoesterase [Thermodesulfobacterium hydrogeniphilum]|uniref:TIGR00282 family metallophosphoesterase n=1 Tax=Thermodesulfobacterium hydrogeniphilum TaxID=161156 RepID=UPI00056FC77B